MFRTLSIATAAAFIAAAPVAAEDKLVTVVTSGEPQTQLMSMVLTMQAIGKGTSVRILLCGAGGDLALQDAPESATAAQPPKGMSPQGLLKAAISKGATAEVCAIYLPGKGATAEVLLEGVGVAAPPAMSDAMMDDDARVWSF